MITHICYRIHWEKIMLSDCISIMQSDAPRDWWASGVDLTVRTNVTVCVCVCVSMRLCTQCSECAVLCNNLKNRLYPLMARPFGLKCTLVKMNTKYIFLMQKGWAKRVFNCTATSRHTTQITAFIWDHAKVSRNKKHMLNSHYTCLK